MIAVRLGLLALLCLSSCTSDARDRDAGAREDAGMRDAAAGDAGTSQVDAASDAGVTATGLDGHRDRILATLGEPCATWAGFDENQRSVFLTITHRLFISMTPDGLPMLAHITRLYYAESSGGDCGGSGNRLFLAMDAYLHGLMVDTWNDARVIGDGGGSTWLHTRDLRGPHNPFDASNESDIGLRCTLLLIESADSHPPTIQAHFFLPGSEVPVERDGGVVLPADAYMLEIDQDYNCVHDSNPMCSDFDEDYTENYGDFECDWVPSACTAAGTGCYRSAS